MEENRGRLDEGRVGGKKVDDGMREGMEGKRGRGRMRN
jgi:hypothetical protein